MADMQDDALRKHLEDNFGIYLSHSQISKITKLFTAYADIRALEARDKELVAACTYWEKNQSKPATYLIERREQLRKAQEQS